MKTFRSLTLIALLLFGTDAFGYITGNVIDPDNGVCGVAMPPDGDEALLSGFGNIIRYKFSKDGQSLMATCIMKNVTYWAGDDSDPDGSPPDRGYRFTPADYDPGWDCLFIYGPGPSEETTDFSVTIMPSGLVKLTCHFDLQ